MLEYKYDRIKVSESIDATKTSTSKDFLISIFCR